MLLQPTIEEVLRLDRRRQDEQERRKLLYEPKPERLVEVWSLKLAGKA